VFLLYIAEGGAVEMCVPCAAFVLERGVSFTGGNASYVHSGEPVCVCYTHIYIYIAYINIAHT